LWSAESVPADCRFGPRNSDGERISAITLEAMLQPKWSQMCKLPIYAILPPVISLLPLKLTGCSSPRRRIDS